MRHSTLFLLVLAILALPAAAPAAPAPTTEVEKTFYALGLAISQNLAAFGLSEAEFEMVKAGLAEVYRGKPAPGFEVAKFREAEEEARKAGRGIWVQGDKYISPSEWRKTHQN